MLTLNNGGNIDSYKQQQAATIALKAYEKLTKQPGYDKEYKYKVPDNVCNKEDAKWDCDPYYPYRRFDGACNNLKHAWWGASSTPYQSKNLNFLFSLSFFIFAPKICMQGITVP